MSIYDDMRAALAEAREIFQAADNTAHSMAIVLAAEERIRRVKDADALRTLKTALRDFDMVTGRWKRTRR
jgi:hypothetical protein